MGVSGIFKDIIHIPMLSVFENWHTATPSQGTWLPSRKSGEIKPSPVRLGEWLWSCTCIGRFSEAGLHEWMPFVIFRARNRGEVAASLPGRFLSRRCFTLYITMEVNQELRSSTNATAVAVAKITVERRWRVGKKWLCVVFWLTRRSRVRGKNVFGGILQHEQQVIACCQTHSDYGPPKMSWKLAM